MLVSLYMSNGPKVIIFASTIAAGTAVFNNILLTQYFLNCCNHSSNYIIRRGI